jgi:hypothetical protein
VPFPQAGFVPKNNLKKVKISSCNWKKLGVKLILGWRKTKMMQSVDFSQIMDADEVMANWEMLNNAESENIGRIAVEQ